MTYVNNSYIDTWEGTKDNRRRVRIYGFSAKFRLRNGQTVLVETIIPSDARNILEFQEGKPCRKLAISSPLFDISFFS